MRQLLRSEAGAALIVALGALVVISLLGAAALVVADGSINQTVWDRSSNQAFGLAEAGFNQATYKARAKTLTAGSYKLVLPNGEASITVTGSGGIFTVKSTGAQPTLADPRARRAVTGKLTVLDPYNMIFSSGGAGGITFTGNATVYGAVYARDKLEMKGTGGGGGKLYDGPLYIKDNLGTPTPTGDLILSGGFAVGTITNPIEAFIDGLTNISGGAVLYASAVYSNVPDLTMPSITGADMPAYRAKSNVVIDNVRDTETNGNYNSPNGLTLDAGTPDFTTKTPDNLNFLSWSTTVSGGNKLGKLAINGTIFVDGPVRIGSRIGNKDLDITFSGKGTIVANGNIAVESNFTPFGGGGAFPASNLIGFLSPNTTVLDPQQGRTIYGTFYSYDEIQLKSQMTFWGSGMSNKMTIENNPVIHVATDISPDNLPSGMPPAQAQTALTSWREVRP